MYVSSLAPTLQFLTFQAPGMYVALNALGAGGLASPWYVNAATAAGYGEYSVQSLCKKRFPEFSQLQWLS